jgi:phospholipid/cholesterol/gamma-HCH transport system substrate-binding protein
MATTATNHWKLGLFVLLAVGAMLGALFWLGARRFHRESFQAVSYFDESVQGLDVGSPVKFRGVTVGTVRDITIAPDHRHVQVIADLYVDALVRLGLSTRAPESAEEFIAPSLRVQLASVGITGVRFIQADFFDPERYPPRTFRSSRLGTMCPRCRRP